MIPFFIALGLVILAAAAVVVQALREKRAWVARQGRRPKRSPKPETAFGRAGRWR